MRYLTLTLSALLAGYGFFIPVGSARGGGVRGTTAALIGAAIILILPLLILLLAGCGGVSLHVHSDDVRMDDLTKRVGVVESKLVDPKSLSDAFANHETRLKALEAKGAPKAEK